LINDKCQNPKVKSSPNDKCPNKNQNDSKLYTAKGSLHFDFVRRVGFVIWILAFIWHLGFGL
jgi:hypothetical protein